MCTSQGTNEEEESQVTGPNGHEARIHGTIYDQEMGLQPPGSPHHHPPPAPHHGHRGLRPARHAARCVQWAGSCLTPCAVCQHGPAPSPPPARGAQHINTEWAVGTAGKHQASEPAGQDRVELGMRKASSQRQALARKGGEQAGHTPWRLSHVGSQASAGGGEQGHRRGGLKEEPQGRPGHMDDTLAAKASGLHPSGHSTA